MPDAIHKATIFESNPGEHPSEEYELAEKWLEKWGEKISVVDYHSSGWEHVWNVSGSKEALDDIPSNLRCASEWADSK